MPPPILSIDEITTPVTRQEVQASVYKILGRLKVNTTTWRKDAVVRATITAFSITTAALSELIADVAKGGFLELATGYWLTLHARYVYKEEADPATYAAGTLQLHNTAGGVYELAAGDLVVSNPLTGKTYRSMQSVTLGALQTKSVEMAATEAGSASSTDAHTITQLVTPPLMTGVELDNPLPFIGHDEESEGSLIAKCNEKLGALSPMGPWDAYSYAARHAKRANGEAIGINRIKLRKDGYGNVYVYVASDVGEVVLSDMEAIVDAIDRNATPQGVTLYCYSAAAHVINVAGTVYVYNTVGMTQAQLTAAIEKQLRAFMAAQPVGGSYADSDQGQVFADGIRAAITNAAPLGYIYRVVLSGGDVTLAVDDVAVLGIVDLEIKLVAPPEGYSSNVVT